MPKLRATTTETDYIRSIRAMVAWLEGDKLALDYVLEQVMADPTGVPGLLFELLECATRSMEELDPDIRDHLRAALLQREQDS